MSSGSELMTVYRVGQRVWVLAHPHPQEQQMNAVPIRVVRDDEYQPDSVRRRAHLHPSTVQKAGQQKKAKRPHERRTSAVKRSRMHPAYMMARALGIERERIEITADPPMWGCIVHNDGSWSSHAR